MMNKIKQEFITKEAALKYIGENTYDNKKISCEKFNSRLEYLINAKCDLVKKEDNSYYIELNFLKEKIEIYNKSTRISDLYKNLKEYTPRKYHSFFTTIKNRYETYMQPLLSGGNIFIDSSITDEILSLAKYIHNSNCITTKELIELMNSTFVGFHTFSKTFFYKYVNEAVEKFNLEVIDSDSEYDIFCFSGGNLFPEKSVTEVIEYFKNFIKSQTFFVNMSFDEYLSLSLNDFQRDYIELTQDELKKINHDTKYARESQELARSFKDTNIKIIKINNGGIYLSEKELRMHEDFINNYVPATVYFREFGIKFDASIAQSNGIEVVTYKSWNYIKKSDVEYYKTIDYYNKSLKETNSLHDRLKLKMDYFPHSMESEYPNVRSLMIEYSKYSKSNRNLAASLDTIYRAILDNIEVDLFPDNYKENNNLFKTIINNFSTSNKLTQITLTFMNYLRSTKNFNLMEATNNFKTVEKEPYEKENFINLFSSILSVTSDSEKLKVLFRNWRLSTSFAYVFLHYCIAWRKNDIVDNLPIVNLSLISNEVCDGEAFIKWLEEGNNLSHKQSKEICKSLEEETERLRVTASKNNVELNCIISDSLMCEVATLLCINEANRQIELKKKTTKVKLRTDRAFLKGYTGSDKIPIQFNLLDIDINSILNGSFDNIRMNKGFLNLVRNKAEELDLFAYYYVQLLRSHKATKEQLSETTKIYLNKAIDRGSIFAFSTGTMGSILYTLIKIIDNDFLLKTPNEQIEAIKCLNITPYQLENSTHIINNKISVLSKEISNYFANKGTKEELFNKIMFDQTVTGIEKKTKCLIKICRDYAGKLKITPLNAKNNKANNTCPLSRRSCIGCDYMIALRYFIYELEKKYNEILSKLENAKSFTDKEIIITIINDLYNPVINDLATILGKEEVSKILDFNRYIKLRKIISCH